MNDSAGHVNVILVTGLHQIVICTKISLGRTRSFILLHAYCVFLVDGVRGRPDEDDELLLALELSAELASAAFAFL